MGVVMRSKIHRTTPASPAPPSSGRRTTEVLVALVLLVVGAGVGVSVERFVNPGSGTASPSPSDSAFAEPSLSASDQAAASGLPDASALESPGASSAESPGVSPGESPGPSASVAAPVLEAEMPHSINGTTMTTQSATDATSLGNNPSNRALDAAVTSLGKKPADLEIAASYDSSGSVALSVLGFRVAGVDPAKLRSVLLESWLASNTPGVKTSAVTLAGTPATAVSYGDAGPTEYVLVHGDGVFLVETTDQALAAAAVAAMKTP